MHRIEPKKCPLCGRDPEVSQDGVYVTVCCRECYDGAPDSMTRNFIGTGVGRGAAIKGWNGCVDDWIADEESVTLPNPI